MFIRRKRSRSASLLTSCIIAGRFNLDNFLFRIMERAPKPHTISCTKEGATHTCCWKQEAACILSGI